MGLFLAVLGLVAFWFLVLPLVVWRVLGEDQSPHFDVFDPTRHPDSPELAAFLRNNVALLIAEGFRQMGDLFRRHGTSTTRVVLMEDDEGVIATVAAVVGKQGNVGALVDFTAELADGRMFTVSNLSTPGVFGPRPMYDAFRLPQVRDPVRLYHVFRALLKQRLGSGTLRRRDLSDPVRFLAESYDREHQWQVEIGYNRLDESARRFRPTLKGAYLMTWKILPPIMQLRRAALYRRARSLLRQIGMEGTDQRPVAAPTSVTEVEPLPGGRQRDEAPKLPAWRGFALLGLFVLLMFAAISLGRRTESKTLTIVTLFGGMLVVLWLMLPRRGRAGTLVPLALFGLAAVGLTGFREFQSRRPLNPDGFSVPSDFGGAVSALERLTRMRAKPLVVRDESGRSDTTSGVYVSVRGPRGVELMDSTIRRQFRTQGFYLFWSVRWDGRDGRYDRVALYPSVDQYVVLRAMHTGGPGRTTAQIAGWLKELETQHPFTLLTIASNNLEGRMVLDSADADEVARQLSDFCPDLERRRYSTIGMRAKDLRENHYFQCWWYRGES